MIVFYRSAGARGSRLLGGLFGGHRGAEGMGSKRYLITSTHQYSSQSENSSLITNSPLIPQRSPAAAGGSRVGRGGGGS